MSIDIDELGIDDTGLKLNGKADSYATVEQVKRRQRHAISPTSVFAKAPVKVIRWRSG
jgi:hypothetical protein